MMPNEHIFFSYSRDDSRFAFELAKELRAAGANVWLDQLDIDAGEKWDIAIENALQTANTLLVILSKTSVASENVMDEVSFAIEKRKNVVPVLMEECDIPFRLSRFHYADFSTDHTIGMKTLIRSLKLDDSISNKLLTNSNEAFSQNHGSYSNGNHKNESSTIAYPKSNGAKIRKKLLILVSLIMLTLLAIWGISTIQTNSNDANNKNYKLEEQRKERQTQAHDVAMKKYKQDLAEWEVFSPQHITQNVLALRGGDALDAELGNISSNLNNSNSWDLRFVCGPNGYEVLRALNGCLWKEVGVQDFNSISYKTIFESKFSSRRNSTTGYPDLFYAHKSNVPGKGYTYFIKTADGNIGILQILDYQNVDINPEVCRNIKLQYKLFPTVKYPAKPQPPN